MPIDKNFKPSPSDFGDFVYCHAKWALSKYDKGKTHKSYGQNEHRCIDWILKKFYATEKQIYFNGTGENNTNFLTSEIDSLGIKMKCKPDLILMKYKRNILFEFKEVTQPAYLYLDEFDSVHAQIWCYTKIKEIHIDDYYLLRYYGDPNEEYLFGGQRSSRCLLLTADQLDSSKFESLFKKYLKAIELLKHDGSDYVKNSDSKTKELASQLTKPPNDKDKKCKYCYHRKINHNCEIYDPNFHS